MATSSNIARLREQTMGSQLEEEAVTVNTRALIDKVLARYSGEWTTLRELIQNAADAQASRVTIRFETSPSSTVPLPQSNSPSDRLRHTILHHSLRTLLVSNDGDIFGENDWSRLKRIAEGNPDETKIGAFGVGFYSVFADCETPFVSSGNQTMAFYWKKDSLFTRRGRSQESESSKETTFMLDYRSSTTPVPQLLSICQFLATSLTFVGLSGIDLWLDDWHILKLNKKMAPGVSINLPRDVNPRTRDGLMKIVGVEYQNAQIDARWMNVVGWNRTMAVANRPLDQPQGDSSSGSLRGWFSRLAGGINSTSVASKRAQKEEEALQAAIIEDLAGTSNATVFLRLSTVSVQTSVSRSLAQELERATKKPPPKQTKIAILTSSYDEASASMSTVSGAGSKNAATIFSSVLPTKNGRIFIGFPTAQTTGLLAHISAPSVIPTVERESIDLNARYVRDWNVEMLRVAGIACRVAFTGEMAELKAKLERTMTAANRKKVTKEDIAVLMPAAVHVYKQYNYEESTPSAKVGQFIEEAFWTCNQKASIDVLSTRGVLPSHQVRVATEDDLSFVEGIPVVPDELMQKAENFITKLRDYGLLSDITTSDIKKELESQAIDEKQVVELLKWAVSKVSSQAMDARQVQTLFDGTVGTVDEEFVSISPSPVIQLGQIQAFVNVARLPAELPTPPNTIPFRLTKALTNSQLSSLGWEELQIVPWLRWIVQTNGAGFGNGQTLTETPAVASQVLPVVSKSWDGLSTSSKQTVHELLAPRTIIPTKQGMRKPAHAYFGNVKLFDDLPTVTGLQGVKEKLLAYLGVRKTVELNVVFDRLMAKSLVDNKIEEGKWSHVDLIKYLVSVKDDIPQEDMMRLQKTPICPAEHKSESAADRNKLYCINQLYEPDDQIKRLGLPVLQWPGLWRSESNEGKFLRRLGLRTQPDVPTLVDIMCKASPNSELHLNALRYFVTNGHRFGYDKYPMSKLQSAFLPTESLPGEKEGKLSKPSECFASPKAAALKFRVLREDLQAHYALLGVAVQPPIELCADRLIRQPPLDTQQANLLFGYFAGRLNDLSPSGSLADKLGNAPIVPIYDKAGFGKRGNVRFATPRSVFIAGPGSTYDNIFDYVDFDQDANSFLLRVGSKHEPSTFELAQTTVREPARLLQILGEDKYLSLLRRLADGAATLKKDKTLWAEMKRAAFLLGQQDSAQPSYNDEKGYGDDEHLIKTSHLATASSMVILDDFAAYRLFQGHLICAPQEEALETFYASLDTPFLSNLAENSLRTGDLLRDQSEGSKLLKLIIERSRLFLFDIDVPIRHDVKWIEKNMSIKVVEFMHMTRRLKGYRVQHVEKQTAALNADIKGQVSLYITSRFDLFEVSRAMVSLLLKRPRQQHYLALETLLESDLRRLKAKGYNVDRILRQKAAETRMADMEKQRRDEEARRQAGAAQRDVAPISALPAITAQAKMAGESHQGQIEAPRPPTPDKSLAMPGSFAESPEQSLSANRKKMSNIFSNITRQLGINTGGHERERDREQEQQIQRMLGSGSSDQLPPPYQSASPFGSKSITPGTEMVTSPKALQQNLNSAIKACRPHDQSSVFSRPETNSIKETPSYCDTRPGHDLVLVGDVGGGIKFFLPRNHSGPAAFLSAHKESLAAFDTVLVHCATIFSLSPSTLNIFHDESGAAIAFNRAGSIFCNLRYFMQLHEESLITSDGQVEAMAYWWITLCHELAHNLVEDHSQQHSYYTESFAHHYFGRMMWWMSRYINTGGQAAIESS